MSPSRRICTINRLTDEAKEIFQELEQQQREAQIAELVQQAAADPLAPYKASRWYPRYVVWELTLACNMRCEHCGSAAGRPRADELTLDEMLRVCDELGELGCERITLLGGEPLIHPHWMAVAQRIKQNGYRANVITNGWTLAQPAVCDKIKEADLSIVGISIDGYGETHDRLRRRPGSFDRILRGMELLRERQIPMAVPTVITNDSLQDLEKIYELLQQNEVRVWQLQIGNPLGRLQRDDPILIAPERLPEIFDFVMAKSAQEGALRIDIADNVGYYGGYEERGIRKSRSQTFFWKGCHAGIQAMGLDSNGDVKGCQSLPSTAAYIEGNVRQRSLKEIWNAPQAFRYTRQFQLADLGGFCAQCQYGPLCKAGCTSAALAHSGNIGENPMCIYRVQQGKPRQP